MEKKELIKLNKFWDATNYLSVGQLYLLDNPLLKEPLKREHIKKKIVGHWGTVPGQNFIYVHLNRIIKEHDLNMIYVSGPGHGGNAMIANTYLEGTYSEVYPNVSRDIEGLQKLFKQFSFPGGVSSHVAPETPGSINEGGELGYSLAHSFGAAFDNPDLIVACVVGDGEAETGPLATAWHSNKFINPISDGAVLPILHLNGYKISNPTIFDRISKEETIRFFEGCGWTPYFVEGSEAMDMHEQMAEALDSAISDIQNIWQNARENNDPKRPFWPMIILKSPKGWTGPKVVDKKEIEGTFRAHQVPLSMEKDEHIPLLETWLKSYKPKDLFTENGKLIKELQELTPTGHRRMGANPHANGGKLLVDLRLPDFRNYAIKFNKPGEIEAQDMIELGNFIRDIVELNDVNKNFRIFGPDETMSNRLTKVFEKTDRMWNGNTIKGDEFLSPNGRIVDSMLSEHMCEGWLEGYLLTGRHGFFASYEAFIRIIDSMASQHAKWLKVCSELPWRRSIASLNYILSSNVWQQDHNGFTHQDPGFIDHVATKKADIVRTYLPPDANCLLSVFDHCIRSKDYINVIVSSKHPRPQWLTMEEAIKHCTQGISIWKWASTDVDAEPDIVLACSGDTPTLEALAAISILKEKNIDIKVRFINVVDLMKLQSKSRHPHGLTDSEYDELFTKNKPIVFAYHGYPSMIHELLYYRTNRDLHVRGYTEEGTITTPFDMRVQNHIDRYHLVMDIVKRIPKLENVSAYITQEMREKIIEHRQYIREYGEDMPEIKNWQWK
jgi:Phosphoketolase